MSVLVAEGDPLIGAALGEVLQGAGHPLDGVVSTAQDAVSAMDVRRSLVVVLDEELPGGTMRVLAATRDLSPARVLVIGRECRHDRLLEVLERGAAGYLSRESRADELLVAVATVSRGEAFVPPAMLGGLLHDLVQRRRAVQRTGGERSQLSRRESEVLSLMAGGSAQEDIAEALVISPQTARTHIQNVMTKLGAHSRLEAVNIAMARGLVTAS